VFLPSYSSFTTFPDHFLPSTVLISNVIPLTFPLSTTVRGCAQRKSVSCNEWYPAALVKCVYDEDPLQCLKYGNEMRIISFIEEKAMIEKIPRHCSLWKKPPPEVEESVLDYRFFKKTCA
jgi:hypothetical protein